MEDKTLCDVSIDVGRDNECKKTFHCVGALIAVHNKILKNKLFCITNHINNNNNNIDRRRSSKIELIESKESEIIELDGFGVSDEEDDNEVESIGGLDVDDSDDDDDDYYSNNISITDISVCTFEYLRCLFYGLNPLITISNVIGIYDMSKKYGLNKLQSASLQYIQSINICNYPSQFISLLLDCQIYKLYQEINELIDKLPDHISLTFFTKMINNESFNQLSTAVVEMLLFDHERAKFEDMPQEYLWIAILKWAKAQQNKQDDNDYPTSTDDENDDDTDNDNDDDDESKQEIIKLSSDDEDSNYNKSMDDIINHKWDQDSLDKLRLFLKYFDFSRMRHIFFREYVQTVKGLLSKHDIITVYMKHADDMIVAMKSMENVIELQRYDSNYDNTHTTCTQHAHNMDCNEM